MIRIRYLLVLALLLIARLTFAQSSQTISYQAYVLGADGKGLDDAACPVHVELRGEGASSPVLWSDDITVPITNGIVNLDLGGHNPLPSSSVLDRQLSVAVSIHGNTPFVTRLSASPYALNVPDSSITAAKLGTDYVSAVTIDGMRVTTKGGPLNLQAGEGLQLSYNEEANAVRIGVPRELTPNSGIYWSESGNNSTSPGSDYLGTSDQSDLWIRVNAPAGSSDGTVMRYMAQATNTNTPSILGGNYRNVLVGEGSIVGGGGSAAEPHFLNGDYSGILSGDSNTVGLLYLGINHSVIGGGERNRIEADHSTIGGGHGNVINTLFGGTAGSTIGGGDSNTTLEEGAFIGGGKFNQAVEEFGVVGGGYSNFNEGPFGTIGGGYKNYMNDSPMGAIVPLPGVIRTQYSHAGLQSAEAGSIRWTSSRTTAR